MARTPILTDSRVANLRPPAAGQEEHRDHKVTGLRLRVGANTKTWIVRARIGKTVINKKLGTYPGMGLAAARKAAEALLDVLARDGSAAALERTFDEVADAWLASLKADKGRSDRYIADVEGKLNRHVRPRWGDRKVVTIRRGDVYDLLGDLTGAVLPNRVLTMLGTIFKFARKRGWIRFHPHRTSTRPRAKPRATAGSPCPRPGACGTPPRCSATRSVPTFRR